MNFIKLNNISLGMLAILTFGVTAKNDIRGHYEEENVIQTTQLMYSAQKSDQARLGALPKVDLVVFYQPSYASTFGEYELFQRIPKFIETLNEAIAAHGLSDYEVVIKDIIPVDTVPDSAPYNDVVDADGNVVIDGAEYLFSLAVLNEVGMYDGKLVNHPEYKIYQEKWKGDLVLYLREQRDGDKHLGLASVGGEFASAVDIGEANLYTTIAHEIGHNFGMDYEESNANSAVEYARAWQCNNKQTLMYSASSQSSTLRHFSNPHISNGGQACGTEGSAYNAKVLVDNYITTSQRRIGVNSLGSVSFTDTSLSGNESEGVTFTLTRDGDLSEAASVKVFAKNGEAIWGEDFVDTFVLAEFEPGEAETTVIYPFIDDGLVEGAESFSVYLQYPYKLSLGESTTANAIVYDGDKNGAGGMVTIDGPLEILEGQSGVFTISRNGGVGEIIVNVSAKSDDAVVGVDYVALNETLVFKAGEFAKTVELVLPNNDIPEPTKSVDITISSPNSSVTYSNAVFKVSLLDDEVKTAGSFSFASNGTTISEALGSIKVKVVREGGFIPTNINVIASVNGVEHVTAAAFSENELEKTVTVDIPANSNGTGDYDLVLTLQSDDASAVVSESTLTYKITRAEPNKPNPTGDGDSGSGGSTGFGFLSLAGLLLFRRLFK